MAGSSFFNGFFSQWIPDPSNIAQSSKFNKTRKLFKLINPITSP